MLTDISELEHSPDLQVLAQTKDGNRVFIVRGSACIYTAERSA